jgi:uncharacterized membrane protein (UPF0127 family)
MIYQLKKNSQILFSKVLWASNPFLKMKGYLGRKSLAKDEALIFPKAPSIHTFFMKFAIDIIFLDTTQKVITCLEKVKPGRILPYINSRYTIEMPEDSIQEKGIKVGDHLLWEESGQTVVEYALLVATLIFSIVVVWPPLISAFNIFIRNIIDYLVDF